jgi:hypothetical protein
VSVSNHKILQHNQFRKTILEDEIRRIKKKKKEKESIQQSTLENPTKWATFT